MMQTLSRTPRPPVGPHQAAGGWHLRDLLGDELPRRREALLALVGGAFAVGVPHLLLRLFA